VIEGDLQFSVNDSILYQSFSSILCVSEKCTTLDNKCCKMSAFPAVTSEQFFFFAKHNALCRIGCRHCAAHWNRSCQHAQTWQYLAPSGNEMKVLQYWACTMSPSDSAWICFQNGNLSCCPEWERIKPPTNGAAPVVGGLTRSSTTRPYQ